MPDPALVVPGIVGALVGALGWLSVGLYIQRKQFIRQAKNAARAVYFEIDLNRLSVQVAKEFGSIRTSIERAKLWMVVTGVGTILSVWGAALALARFLRP